MPQYTNSTASPILKEQFDKNVVNAIAKRNTTFSWFMSRVSKVDINDRGYYFSAKTRRNQGYGSLTAAQEGGLMPRSGVPAYKKIRADYQDHFIAGEMSGRVRDAPNDAALLRMSKDYMMDAEESFTHFQDFYLFGNGSGALGVATTGYVAATITFALAAATPYGSTKIQPTQRLHFINPADGTQRTGGDVTVSTVISVNSSTDVVTFDAVPDDVVANDIVVIEDTYGREMQGFDYHLNDANTTWLKDGETGVAITRADHPWTKANVYDASAAAISPAFLDAIALRTTNQKGDGKIAFDAVMLSHPVQQYGYMQLGYALTRVVNASGNDKLDLGFANVSHNGMQWRVSQNAQPDRIYGLTLSEWIMPVVKMPQMYTFPGGDSLIQKYGTDRPYDAVQFYVYARFNVVCRNPSTQWMIKNLSFTAANVRTNVF
jgi:hypothetical protein